MANEELFKLIKQGVEGWNSWKENNPDAEIDFSSVDLRGINLQSANLKNANFREAKLQFVNFTKANLEGAILEKAKMQEVNLQSANLMGASLKKASLLDANLQYVNMENADLRKAQFNEEALFISANLKGANLSTATGLNEAQIEMAVTDSKTKLPEYFGDDGDDEFVTQF
ncbi:MAG: pentapeptide repeat-containing protein [Nitrospinales bacterium]